MDRSKTSDSTRKYICVHGLNSWLSTSFEFLKWNCDIISGQLTLTYFTQKFPLQVIIFFFRKYIISKSLKLNVLNFNRHHVTIPSLTSVNQKYGSILDVLGDYLTAMAGVFSYGGRRPSQNVYLVW